MRKIFFYIDFLLRNENIDHVIRTCSKCTLSDVLDFIHEYTMEQIQHELFIEQEIRSNCP